jgi:hypothetical protein
MSQFFSLVIIAGSAALTLYHKPLILVLSLTRLMAGAFKGQLISKANVLVLI